MRRRAVAVVAGLLAGAVIGGPTAAASAPTVSTTEEITRFRDSRITESSGAVVIGDWLVTTNDSGDVGQVFTLDLATGETVGVTTWSDAPVDVEALAPAGPTSVWVGDIGDNDADRVTITVTRVPVGDGDRDVDHHEYELIYPDGARDAESLLTDPATGRLYVATKEEPRGTLYVAPRRLQRAVPNVLSRVGRVGRRVTDGAFFPSGEHLVIRRYAAAQVYSFPDLRQVAEFDLPQQRQGEGVSVTADNQLVLTSEGEGAPVLQVPLPDAVAELVGPPVEPSPSASPTSEPSGSDGSGGGAAGSNTANPADPGAADSGAADSGTASLAGVPWWGWATAAGVGLLLALMALVARARRPGRPEAGM